MADGGFSKRRRQRGVDLDSGRARSVLSVLLGCSGNVSGGVGKLGGLPVGLGRAWTFAVGTEEKVVTKVTNTAEMVDREGEKLDAPVIEGGNVTSQYPVISTNLSNAFMSKHT